MYATISADIVSSTSLCIEETIALKQRIEDLFSVLEQHLPFGLDLHNLHHAVQHIVLYALDDGLRLFRVEVICLKRRLYPCEDLGELPVFYPDARHEGGRGVLQGAVFLPFKLSNGEACYGFHVGLACTHTSIDRTEILLTCF